MAIVTVCHSEGVGSFACAQAGCPDCLEALLRENDGLIHYDHPAGKGSGAMEYAGFGPGRADRLVAVDPAF